MANSDVYVLVETDHYDYHRILGVFATEEAAFFRAVHHPGERNGGTLWTPVDESHRDSIAAWREPEAGGYNRYVYQWAVRPPGPEAPKAHVLPLPDRTHDEAGDFTAGWSDCHGTLADGRRCTRAPEVLFVWDDYHQVFCMPVVRNEDLPRVAAALALETH